MASAPLTAVFLVWAGSKARVVKLPSSSAILLVLVGVAAAVGLALMVRPAGGSSAPW
jgi:EamA domain-containing membrane protein RarD